MKNVELNADNDFEAVLIEMVELHRRKAQDYASPGEENSNFRDTAHQLNMTSGHSVELLIATKQARLRVLLPKHWKKEGAPANEPIQDTLLDRAVYSVIALTIWNEGGYDK
jgi:hypothetical protein